MTETPPYLTTPEVMRFLRIARSTVYSYVYKGILHPVQYKHKTRLRFNPLEVYRIAGIAPPRDTRDFLASIREQLQTPKNKGER